MSQGRGLNQLDQEVCMPQVVVTDRSGEESVIAIRPGTSLMQAITDDGIAELLALCGGVCSCGTCHVYIQEDALAQLPPMEQDENDLLACSAHRAANSRLACQIRLCEDHDGLRATIAPEDL
jgi:2Fe-2S ferredoxin